MKESLGCLPMDLIQLSFEYANAFEGIHVHTLCGHDDSVLSVVQLSNGQLASASGDLIRIWDTETGECKMVLRGHEEGDVNAVVELLNGLLASGADDETIRLWDVDTGECKHVLEGHESVITRSVTEWTTCIGILRLHHQTVECSHWRMQKGARGTY